MVAILFVSADTSLYYKHVQYVYCTQFEARVLLCFFVPRALTKFFFHTFTSNEALDMTTNILEEAKSTTLNDLQVSL